MTDGKTVVAGFDTTVSNPTKFKEEAGEWNDIMVDNTSTSPIPVIIYYNKIISNINVFSICSIVLCPFNSFCSKYNSSISACV